MRLRPLGGAISLLILFALVGTSPVAGQTLEKGSITGTVYDPLGAGLPGATIKLTRVATGLERTGTTDQDGRYAFSVLPPGEYRMEVSARDFATASFQEINLAVGQELVKDVTLIQAVVSKQVAVASGTEAIDTSETYPNVVIDEIYLRELPISGRDFRDFANLAGTADTSPGLRSPVRLNGQEGEYTGLMIDGVDQRNSFFGEWFGSLETKNFTFPQDAIQEFQVRDSGFPVEFGHATGGLINVVTRSGTNDWHGSGHWFILPDTFVADTYIPDTGTTVPPPFNIRHQFGGSVGGPLARDKAFIFFAVEDQQQQGPLTAMFGNQTGLNSLCPCPVPELSISDLRDLQGQATQRQDLLAPFLRLDFNLGRHTLTTRANYTRNKTDAFTGFAGSQTFVQGRVSDNFENFINDGYAVAQSVTSVIRPKSVNEFRFSFSKEKRPRRRRADFTQETVIAGVPGVEEATGNFGPAFFLPIDSTHRRVQFLDDISYSFGKQDVKLGIDLNSNATSQIYSGFAGGQYTFRSLADFIARRPLFLLQLVGIDGLTASESGILPDFWQHDLSFYIQDHWKIHPRVEVNMGLRWDGVWNPKSKFGLPPGTVPVGKPRISSDGVEVDLSPTTNLGNIPNDFNNWAPRVGVAWDIKGDGKTIVRGGMGFYYSATPTIFWASALSGPGLRGAVLSIPFDPSTGMSLLPPGAPVLTYPDLLPSAADATLAALVPPPAIEYADPNLQSVRVLNFQAGVEREIVPSLSVSATYTQNRSENLRTGGFFSTPWDRNVFCDPATIAGCQINATSAFIPGSQFDQYGRTIDAFNLPRLDPGLGIANEISSFGKGRYHALLVQVRKAFSDRFQLGINYSVSGNKDNASSDRDTDAFNGPSDPFKFLVLDYGRSQLDIRSHLTAYGYFVLPWDLHFSTIFTARSGRAFPVWGSLCSDPGVVAPFGLGGATGMGFQFQDAQQCSNNFDPIRPVVSGELLSRYPIRNDGLFNWDIRLGRAFPLGTDRLKLRVTFEVFDLTDRKNFFTSPTAARDAILGDPTFRQRNQFVSTRSAQIGLKLDW
ncbi:MAG TPA: TonB-dependent receptor [Terriglobia bacterium]|nr:TonB-dependent receptor [Terriglobia bacterium]